MQSLGGELLVHDICVHVLVGVFIVPTSAASRLGGKIDISFIVIGEESSPGTLSDLFVSLVQTGLETSSLAQVYSLVFSFVVNINAFVGIVLLVAVIPLIAFSKKINIILG